MKKEVTQYFCDICGEEILDFRTAMKWLRMGCHDAPQDVVKEHVCPACYRVIEERVSLLAQGAKRD